MGKKTTEFMNSIKKLEGELLDSLKEVIGVTDSYKSARDEYDQLFEKHEKITAKFMPNNKTADNRGSQKENPEKLLAADPEFKKVEAEIEKVRKQMEDLMDWKDSSKTTLTSKTKELKDTVGKFKAFVDKKKSAWFGNKKSVPAAEVLIDEANGTVTSIGKVIKSL